METQQQVANGAMKNGAITIPSNGKVLLEDDITDYDKFDLASYMSGAMSAKRSKEIKPSDKTTKASEIARFVSEGDELFKLSEKYVDQFVSRGNDALYRLLASVYSFALRIDEHYAASAIVGQIKAKLKSDYDIKVGSKAGTMATVVKYVIRSDKKTASRYAKVLEVAQEENLSPEDLPAYISRRGGISQIQEIESKALAKKQGSKESKERMELLREFYNYLSYKKTFPKIIYDSDIFQHNFENQTASEKSQFTIFLAVEDYDTADGFKILSAHDLGRTFEDVLFKFLTKSYPSDLRTLEVGVRNLKKKFLEDDDISAGLRDKLKSDLAQPFKYEKKEIIEVDTKETPDEDS